MTDPETRDNGFTLKGWHVFAMVAAFFGIIIAVNVTMAVFANRTFPGVEVANSYVESQSFDVRARAQNALTWKTALSEDGGIVTLIITDASGALVRPATLAAKAGRPTLAKQDRLLDLRPTAEGYRTETPLPEGPWRIFLAATAEDGTQFQQTLALQVSP